ncbi:MAG TPA: oligosaccharide flippase family protein, partial [Anaerolineae bacterium]|nr:oligosaccharide flippase family protein [Anaerolineae bacterium]
MTDDSVTTSTNDQTPRSAPEPAMNGSTIARIAVRNTVWVGLGSYATQIIGFVATIAITRILSPEVFGIFSLATFWFTLLNLRTKSGINYAAIRHTENNGELLGTYLALDAAFALLSLLLSVIAGLILIQYNLAPVVAITIVVLMVADGIATIV